VRLKTVFLSFSFRDADRELVARVEQLLASHNITVVTGRRLGGGQLTPEIMQRIDDADGLVALLTRRDQLATGGWTTHNWVRDELNRARQSKKRAIALIETEVQTGGAYGSHEHIPLDRANPIDAFLALSETLGIWQMMSGRTTKVSIMPEALAQHPGHATGQIQCQYRFLNRSDGKSTSWKTASTFPEGGGAVAFLDNVQDDHLIQLKVNDGQTEWLSPLSPQLIVIELKPVTGGA
jgi:hypothetical protein